MSKDLFYKRMKEIFDDEYDIFLKKISEPLSHSFFLNTNKAKVDDILSLIDFDITKSKYNDNIYNFDNQQIGKTKAYDLGLIYPQEASASIPALILNPKENSLIVDMCSAPGGKSINLANITNDNSLLVSNEYEYKRAMILTSNIERLGLSNIIVTNKTAKELAKDLYHKADYVLLDAPCSGEGMARKHKSIIEEFSDANIALCIKRQEELIEEAYKILNNDGYLVYSTCTYEYGENEKIVKDFIDRHLDMELIHINDKYQKRGFDQKESIRFSILDGTEGQFAALLHKKGNKENNSLKYKKVIKNRIIEEFLKNELGIEDYYLYEQNGHYYLSFKPLLDLNKNVLRYGIYLGEIKKNIFYPSHAMYRANALRYKFKRVIELNDEEYLKYRQGLSFFKDIENGYYLLTYRNFSFGFTKVSNKELKNKYPKGLRY